MRSLELVIIYCLSIGLCVLSEKTQNLAIIGDYSYLFAMLAFLVLPFLAIWIFRKNEDEDHVLSLEWNAKEALQGLLIACALFLPVLLGVYIWRTGIGSESFHFSLSNYQRLDQALWFSLLVQLFLVALPEEFFYRGYLQTSILKLAKNRFNDRKSKVLAITVTSLLFALGHVFVSGAIIRLNTFFPSLLFGYLRIKNKTLTACIVLHALSNIMMEVISVHFFP